MKSSGIPVLPVIVEPYLATTSAPVVSLVKDMTTH